MKVGYDADDVETDDADLAVKYVYTVTLRRRINGQSFNAALITKVDTSADIKIETPHQLSTAPLSGNFRIQCPDYDGNLFTTPDIGFNHYVPGIDSIMQASIPHLAFRMRVHNLYDYDLDYRQNMVIFAVSFDGIQGDVPTCEILDGEDTPISGNDVTFSVTTVREYGINRWWDAIPLEFLLSDA